MPQKDQIHEPVKQALIKNGWQVTDDPYVISYGERFLFVDLGATKQQACFIGAQRKGSKIAVEIKEFRGKSAINSLEQAVGQYILYQLLLRQLDPERTVYLAVSDITYDEIFSEPVGELVIKELPLNLLVVNTETCEVKQWIQHNTKP